MIEAIDLVEEEEVYLWEVEFEIVVGGLLLGFGD